MDVGVEINQYVVVEHIGRGGMADVWSARDKRLNRTVAIKTVARDLATDDDPVELFEREARTIATLEHPHILPIYDFGSFEGQLYIVMRYVTGGSLESLVADGPLSMPEALRIGRAVGGALDYAHTNNVIHLDIKPSNILLDSNQSPYLADFGLATVTDPEGRAVNPGYGTLLYMAPEQLTAAELDHRADIYSFTILMFHLVTGELPFDATTSLALKQLQFQEDLPDLDKVREGLPLALTPVLRRGTSLNPAMRPSSVGQLMNELEQVLNPQPVTVGVPDEMLIFDPDDNTTTLNGETADLHDLMAAFSPADMAKQEAVDLYQRARRAWAHGQGRFLLGITHFMLISDYYTKAAENDLELDYGGRQMLLRGALEYDHEVDYWWSTLDDENRRWVALHAVRSDNAPARVRALYRLETLPDSDPPRIPGVIAQGLQVEQDEAAKRAAVHVLATRAQLWKYNPHRSGEMDGSMLTTRRRLNIQLSAPSIWRNVVYAEEIDELLATVALDWEYPAVAEQAARTIGRIRSLHAANFVAEKQRQRQAGALRTLALIRDEVPYLPAAVSPQARFYAWLSNTARRLTVDPMGMVWRFVFGFLGGFIAMSLYAWVNLSGGFVLINEVTGRAISTGITFGVFIGFVVMLAGEFPLRLQGFWPWWARLLASVLLGTVAGALTWTVYTWLLLYNVITQQDIPTLIIGGFGTALGFALAGTFKLHAGLSALLSTAILFGFIAFSFYRLTPPFLYFTSAADVLPQGLMVTLAIVLGGFTPMLGSNVWQMVKAVANLRPDTDQGSKRDTQPVPRS